MIYQRNLLKTWIKCDDNTLNKKECIKALTYIITRLQQLLPEEQTNQATPEETTNTPAAEQAE